MGPVGVMRKSGVSAQDFKEEFLCSEPSPRIFGKQKVCEDSFPPPVSWEHRLRGKSDVVLRRLRGDHTQQHSRWSCHFLKEPRKYTTPGLFLLPPGCLWWEDIEPPPGVPGPPVPAPVSVSSSGTPRGACTPRCQFSHAEAAHAHQRADAVAVSSSGT